MWEEEGNERIKVDFLTGIICAFFSGLNAGSRHAFPTFSLSLFRFHLL